MELGTRILLDLFLMYAAAVVGGAIPARVRQPPVIGELLAGIIIGPHVLGLAGVSNAALIEALGSRSAATAALEGAFAVLAELGLILLLFFVGLELRIAELLAVGRRATLVGLGGVVFPFVAGYVLVTSLGWERIESVFLAAALVATSTGISVCHPPGQQRAGHTLHRGDRLLPRSGRPRLRHRAGAHHWGLPGGAGAGRSARCPSSD
jgi:Kef-type K+ transport system membrane component KefB